MINEAVSNYHDITMALVRIPGIRVKFIYMDPKVKIPCYVKALVHFYVSIFGCHVGAHIE